MDRNRTVIGPLLVHCIGSFDLVAAVGNSENFVVLGWGVRSSYNFRVFGGSFRTVVGEGFPQIVGRVIS